MADGNLVFDTKIDDTDFEKGIKSMDSSVEGLKAVLKTLSGYMEKLFKVETSNPTAQSVENMSSKMMSFNEQLRKAEIELENAKKKLQDFTSQQIPTEEYVAAEIEAGKIEQKLLSLLDKKERFEETGGNRNSRTYQQMQYDIDMVEKKLESAEGKMCRLNEEGKRFKTGDEEQFEKLTNGVNSAQGKVDILKQKMSELAEKEKATGDSGNRANSIFNKMSSATQKLSSKLFKATKNTAAMGGALAKNVNPAPKMISGVSKKVDALGKKIGGMIKRVFVFSMMTKALRALRSSMQSVIATDKDMAGSLAKIKGNLLTAFAPLYSFVLPAIKAALSALVTFTNYLANVMSSIFGKTISQSKALAQEINKNSQATDKNTKSTKKNNKEKERQLSGLDQMNRWNSDKDSDKDEGSSTAPVFNATEMNVDWVDKIKKMMASGNWEGIGEFVANKLNDSLKKIPWGKIQSTAKSIATKLAKMLNGFFSVMDLANTLGNTVAQALNTGLMFAYTFLTTFNFGQFGTFIGTSINSFIKNFKWGLLGDTLGSAVQGAIDTAYGFVTTYEWGSFASGIADSVNHFFATIKWDKAGETVGKAISGIFTEISTFLAEVKWEDIGEAVLEFLCGIKWDEIFSSLIEVIKNAIGGIDGFLTGIFGEGGATTIEAIAAAIGTLVAALKLYNIATGIAEAKTKLVAIAKGALDAVMAINPFFLIVAAIMALIAVFVLLWNKCDGFREFWINLWEKIKEVAGVAWEAIKGFFVSAWDFIKSVWNKAGAFFSKVWKTIKKVFGNVVGYFKGIFQNAWDCVKSVFSTVKSFFTGIIDGVKKIFSGFIDFITGIFTGNWKKAWEGVKKIFKGVWDVFYTIVKTPINLIIDGINYLWKNIYKAISSIVNTVGDVAAALGDLFGQDWHFKMPDNPPTIPKLAKGAVIPPRSEFMAILGDQKHGTNIETPENLLRQIMREELGKMNTAGGGTYEFIAQINRRTLFDEVIKEGKLRKKTTGRNAFQF
ncbi:MAG: hypothetical protein HFG29_01410 [Eubacterium sp.]|nr:hypothetical protein [Eubacterium sp.]